MLEEKDQERNFLSLKFRCTFMKLVHVVCNQLKNFDRVSLINFVNLRFHKTTSKICRCETRECLSGKNGIFLHGFLSPDVVVNVISKEQTYSRSCFTFAPLYCVTNNNIN